MTEQYLSCNLSSCRKKLSGQACITSCSHIFCTDHLPNMMGNERQNICLACGTKFRTEMDIVQANLNPTEQYKAMVLTGLNPDQIMEVVTHALGFFVYQINYDSLNKESTLRHVKEQNEELRHYCASLTTKFKADLQKQQKTIENLKLELEAKMKDMDMQRQQLAQAKMANKKLQSQLDTCKREIVNIRAHPGANSPCVPNNSHSNRNPHQRVAPPLNYMHFYPGLNGYQNPGGFGNPAHFTSPFKPQGRFSH